MKLIYVGSSRSNGGLRSGSAYDVGLVGVPGIHLAVNVRSVSKDDNMSIILHYRSLSSFFKDWHYRRGSK